MAALRFEASADGKAGVTRLAHHEITVTAHTWRTSVRTAIKADGRVLVSIERDGRTIQHIEYGAE